MCSQEQSLSSSTNAALSNLARDPPLIFSRIYAEIADPCASANLETRRVFFSYKIITLLQILFQPSVIMVYISHLGPGKQCPFLLDTSQDRERVYKWKFCPFVCPSVITSYSFPFLSDSKLRRVTQPLPQYPMSPIYVSHACPHSPVNWSLTPSQVVPQ